MRKFQDDYYFGMEGELASYVNLKTLTNNPLTHSRNPFAPFDFVSSDVAIEHKSRTCPFNTYPTAMIKLLKVMRCLHLPKGQQGILAFRFTDGLYYIKYCPLRFENYKKDCIQLEDREGFKEKPEPRIYIPTEHLTLLKSFKAVKAPLEEGPQFLD